MLLFVGLNIYCYVLKITNTELEGNRPLGRARCAGDNGKCILQK
jgi:hypothetical protein